MKKIIFSLAVVMLLGGLVKADEVRPPETTNDEITNYSDDSSSIVPLEDTSDFDLLAPHRGDDGRRRGGGRHGDDRGDWRGGDRFRRHPPYRPPYRPPYNPPRYQSWTCIANDRGWEEHYGGHAGYGRSQWEAAENAIYICRLSHGECYISRCY